MKSIRLFTTAVFCCIKSCSNFPYSTGIFRGRHGMPIPNIIKLSSARPDPLFHLLGDKNSRGGRNPGRSPEWRVRGAAKTTCSRTTNLPYRCICVSIHQNEIIATGIIFRPASRHPVPVPSLWLVLRIWSPVLSLNTLNTFPDQESTCFWGCTCMHQACTRKHLWRKDIIS